MVFIQKRKAKGEVYLYLDKSIRIGKKVHKISKFLGKQSGISPQQIEKEKKKFALEIDTKIVLLLVAEAKKRYPSLEFPLTIEEIKKIEEMNLKYKELMKNVDERVGYKKLQNIILGRAITLTAPENVSREIRNLLKWYWEKENKT